MVLVSDPVLGTLPYVVIGSTLSQIAENGDLDDISGDAIDGSGLVSMAANQSGIVVVVDPETGYAYATNSSNPTAIARITDPVFLGFGGVGDVIFIDGYFLFRVKGSARFFHSDLNALTFNALNVATAEGAPDDLVGMIANLRTAVLPGETSMEIWYNASNEVGSAFSRSPDGFIEIGCAARASIANQDNSVFWLANDRTFRKLTGVTPEKISNYGIDAIVTRMSVIEDCFAVPFTQEGHLFVAWTFPFEGRTLVYDCSTTLWSERDSSQTDSGATTGIWAASCVLMAYGKQLVGSYLLGEVGYFDSTLMTEFEDENPMRISWTYEAVYDQGARLTHNRLEVITNVGAGLSSGQGSNPLMTLFVSNDGGETFTAKPLRSMGAQGKYQTRMVWWKLGQSRNRVYRIAVTDPVPVFALDTLVDVGPGRP